MIRYNHSSCFGFRPLNFLFDVLYHQRTLLFWLALRRNVEDKSFGLLAYKAPVVILEGLYLPNDCSVDTWSMGVLTLKYTLFGPWLPRTSEWSGRQYIKTQVSRPGSGWQALTDLANAMLEFDPEKRPSATDCSTKLSRVGAIQTDSAISHES